MCVISKLTLYTFFLVATESGFTGESKLGFFIGTFSFDGLVGYKVKSH